MKPLKYDTQFSELAEKLEITTEQVDQIEDLVFLEESDKVVYQKTAALIGQQKAIMIMTWLDCEDYL